ncbi:cytochrome P450 [Ideonella sp.]|uniref:cytochrome P450 n=1 Tax=Ideonella sp. TaxID=1929293 RepID=UPI002D7FF973|nr:cytochrome P450 [Ideonella sp.]
MTRPQAVWRQDLSAPPLPYDQYRHWREAGPLLWSEAWFDGAWLVTRYADCEALLRDSTRFSARRTGGWVTQQASERGELSEFQRLFARAMLFVDAPHHGRLRQLMQPGFTPAAMRGLRSEIESFVAQALDQADAAAAVGQSSDLIALLARPLPARVMALLLGLSDEDPELFSVASSDDLAAFIGAAQPSELQARRAQRAMLRLARGFEAVLETRSPQGRAAPSPPPEGDKEPWGGPAVPCAPVQATPSPDLLDRLLQGQAEGRITSDAELLAQCVMLLFAGHETTRHLIGSLVQTLASDPLRWRMLREQPDLIPRAVREVLRLETPVQYTGRRAVADVQWHGQTIRRGELVLAMVGCANRDEARFSEAEQLDLARQQGASLAFGTGPHVCIGAALTQMEAEVVLQQMVQRWHEPPQLLASQPDWIPDALYRGLRSLPVMPARHVHAPLVL